MRVFSVIRDPGIYIISLSSSFFSRCRDTLSKAEYILTFMYEAITGKVDTCRSMSWGKIFLT